MPTHTTCPTVIGRAQAEADVVRRLNERQRAAVRSNWQASRMAAQLRDIAISARLRALGVEPR